ncbi:MAG: LysR family transcriptional regulator [Acidiphilium sp. 34-60-192]|nr:MAG: LysR family transcriptional regulator [Acidiphilium sp. 34-60-192]
MRNLNFNHLRYFWAVAHEGSLTKAADRMSLSQSASLFERTGKRLILTEAGRIALDYADEVFKAGDELIGTLRGQPAANRQALRVGALPTLSRNFQLEFLRPLVGRQDVDLIVRSGNLRELLVQLDAHLLDVVLSNSAAPRDARSALRNHRLDEQPVSLVGHPRGRRRAFRFPEDLRTEPVLVPSLESDMRIAFDRIMEQAGIRPTILAEVDDMAMLRLLARERDAVTLVPPIVVRDELEAGTLVELCRIPDVTERFYAIVQTRRFPNPLLTPLLPGR